MRKPLGVFSEMDGGQAYLDGIRMPAVLRGIAFISPATFQFSFDTGEKDADGRPELLKLEPSSDRWVRMADHFLNLPRPVCRLPNLHEHRWFSSDAMKNRLRCPGVIVGIAFGCFVDFEFDYSKDWEYRDILACFEVLET